MADRPMNTTAPSVSGPGKNSKRTDLRPSNRPVRIATGQPYGSAKQQEQMQNARPNRADATPMPSSSPGAAVPAAPPVAMPAAAPPDLDVIAGHPTAYPGRPIGAPPTPPTSVSTEEAVFALEQLIARAGNNVSAATLRLLNDLKRESVMQPSGIALPDDAAILEDF